MYISLNIKSKNSEKVIKFNYILLGILLLSTVLRLYNLGFQGAWLDELHTLKEADPDVSLKEFHQVNMFREGIPHFYFLIVRFFGIIFGHSLYSIRLVSVICGILGVFSMYLLGKEISNKQTGYIAAFLLAIHPFHIEYSQEGRSYALLVLFVILAFYRVVLFLKTVNLKNAIYLGLFTGLITNAQPIGIISVISIFLILSIYFFFLQTKTERINYIKYTFITGITTLLVFLPVYPKVVNASKISSFWVLKPTYEYVNHVLNQISGGTAVLLYLSTAALVALFINTVIKLRKKNNLKSNTELINFIIVFIWVVFYFAFILLKSLGETSLVLTRYLIPVTPGFVLAISLTISLIKNSKIKILVVAIFAYLFLHSLFIDKKYYSTRLKSQFNDICQQIVNENKTNEVVISNWGWLLSFYLDKDFKIRNVYEKNLDVYINDVKTNSVIQENFWYVDGNSRPYTVATETQEFIDANYQIDKTIDLQDSWAKHFVSKKPVDLSNQLIKLNQFTNARYDGSGNLMFFENSKSTYKSIFIAKGNYKLIIKGKSLPEQKINNENSKLNIILNNKKYRTIELSEKEIKEYEIDYVQPSDGNLIIEIEFTNDFTKDDLDRNAQITNIQMKKI